MQDETGFPRASIFDHLKEKHPDPAESLGSRRQPKTPVRHRPPMFHPVDRTPRSRAGLVAAIVVLFAGGGLGLFSFYPHPAAAPEVAPGVAQLTRPETEEPLVTELPGVPAPEEIPAAAAPSVPPAKRERTVSLASPAIPVLPALEEPRSEPETPPHPEPEASPDQVAQAPEPSTEPAPAPATAESAPAEPEAVAEFHPAVKTFSAAPDYPEAARLAGLSGTVIVEAEIDPTGSVASTRVLRGVSPELDQAARDAVGRWRFEPATSNGQPAADTYRAAIHFELEPPKEQETEVAALPAADDFKPPERLYAPPPTYPPADWVSAVEGDVVVRAAISETGLVTGVEILKGLTAGLNKAAVEALKRWRFRPATRKGEAVASNQVLTFRFAR